MALSEEIYVPPPPLVGYKAMGSTIWSRNAQSFNPKCYSARLESLPCAADFSAAHFKF